MESESSAAIVPHELVRTRQLESVHLKFNQESGTLLPLCLRYCTILSPTPTHNIKPFGTSLRQTNFKKSIDVECRVLTNMSLIKHQSKNRDDPSFLDVKKGLSTPMYDLPPPTFALMSLQSVKEITLCVQCYFK